MTASEADAAARNAAARTRCYLVCDRCGHIAASDRRNEVANGRWTCCECGATSAWEFPLNRRTHAETHAARIAGARRDR